MDFYSTYIVYLADNALILGHRNSEWTGHGPILEQDIALSNVALDLIGQARNFYQLAATHINTSASQETLTEDDLAYLRNPEDFRNLSLVEQPNGDWAKTMLRQFYFSTFQILQYENLIRSADKNIKAISEKSIKETRYHVRWSGEWVLRLGDGTDESHSRILNAMNLLNPFLPELFMQTDFEKKMSDSGILIQSSDFKAEWIHRINLILAEATLPEIDVENISTAIPAGKKGIHTRHLGELLSEMQILQRTYPDCNW
jgi:ring-1,2-phenylacetyl-CoA epoxidase subunit PaaC